MIKVNISKFKSNNNRDRFYILFINLLNDLCDSKTKKELILNRRKIDILITRLSNKTIESKGMIDYDNTIKIINACYEMAFFYGIYKLIKLIYNDMISFAQQIRMIGFFPFINNLNIWKIIQPLNDDLYLICYSYFTSRSQENKWKNIGMQLINIDLKENFMSQENLRVSAFKIGIFIIDNDSLNNYFKLSTKEVAKYIIWLLKHKSPKGFPKKKFESAIMTLIGKYAAKFFNFTEKNIFHITNIKNAMNMINSEETWIRKREYLNDEKEQKSFSKIINHSNLLSKDRNNRYRSISFTTSNSKQTIFKYGKSYKNAVVFEFDKFNCQNAIYTWMIYKINNDHFFVDFGSMIGKIIYDEEKIKKYWKETKSFILKIKNEYNADLSKVAEIKIANIFKMFYKNKKWKKEKEIRVIALDIESINTTQNEKFIKHNPSIFTSFNKIFSSDENANKMKKLLLKKPIFKESFNLANEIIHRNDDKILPEINDLFKKINEFKK